MTSKVSKSPLSPELRRVPLELYASISRRTVGKNVKSFKSRVRDFFPSSRYDVDDLKAVIASVDDESVDGRHKVKCNAEALAEFKDIMHEIVEGRSVEGRSVEGRSVEGRSVESEGTPCHSARSAQTRSTCATPKRKVPDTFHSTFSLGDKEAKRTFVATFVCTTCCRSVDTESFRESCRCFHTNDKSDLEELLLGPFSDGEM